MTGATPGLTARQAALIHALPTYTTIKLREIIADERAEGRAFGRVAEACRNELAKRGQQP